jgi:hypothetical protein
MIPRMRLSGLVLMAVTAVPTLVGAAGEIALRVSLVHGQNADITDNLQECSQFRQSLVKLFGYQRYERLGTATALVGPGTPATLQPTRTFQVRLESDPKTTNVFHFHLLQDDEALFRGKFVPKDGVPLIIRGPQYHRGILIIVVNKDLPTP